MTTMTAEGGAVRGTPETYGESVQATRPDATPSRRVGEIDADALLRLGQVAGALSQALGTPSWQAQRTIRRTQDAVATLPFVEKAQAEGFDDDDIRANRRVLLRAAGYGYVDRLARTAEAIGWQAPGKRIEQKMVNTLTSQGTADLIEDARQKVEAAAGEVEFIAGFDNPRQSFLDEVDYVATKVGDAILDERAARMRQGGQRVEKPHDTPPGIKGIVTKVIRKIKNFFGFFRRHKPRVEEGVTAYDAAGGMQRAFQGLMNDSATLQKETPMLKRYLFDRLPAGADAKHWHLALAAPEILDFLFSTAPDKPNNRYLASEVRRHPHELYFATRYKRQFNASVGTRQLRLDIDRLRAVATTMLPALAEVLPTSGQAIRDTYANLLGMLQMFQYVPSERSADEADDDLAEESNGQMQPRKQSRRSRIWSKLRKKS